MPTDPCANPLCREPIERGQAFAIELHQRQEDGADWDWTLCSIGCARTYLALCDAKVRAQAERVAS